MFRFASPDMFWLLLPIVVVIAVYILAMRARRRRLAKFGDRETLSKLIPDSSPRRIRNKFILFIMAAILLVFALARPQSGAKLKEVETEGLEIIFALDVSNSMLANDLEPNRLERTKYAINRILETTEHDKIGLVVFAGDAYVQLPITTDYVAARNFVSQASPNMVSRQGTAIGAAIELATMSFSSQSEGSRIIILISDGENHEDDAIAAANAAKELGVTIYTIGVGTPEGVFLEINGELMRDNEGNPVVTRLDESMLEQIALVTGGAYIRASNRSVGLNEILDKVNETEKSQFNTQIFDEYDEHFQYLVGAAIILLVVNILMLSRKNKLLARFNIFRDSDKI